MLQEILNHSTPQIILRYIGINKEEKDNVSKRYYTYYANSNENKD